MVSIEYHQPVMLTEVADYLVNRPSGCYVDCTLGGGGHSRYLLQKYPDLRIIGIDQDEAALEETKRNLAAYDGRIEMHRDNFRNIRSLLSGINVPQVDGVLADLGVSSRQLDDVQRGFSFQSPSLDMRMDTRTAQRAEDLVNTLDAESLADIFYQLGEERLSRPISRAIVNERQKKRITSGAELAAVVERVKRRQGKTHPATKVFQALRIAVNSELESLTLFLDQVPDVLASGGRCVILSYHSLEDRIIKRNFRKFAQEGVYRLLTKKVAVPGPEELKDNPRSRSAKLRAAEKV